MPQMSRLALILAVAASPAAAGDLTPAELEEWNGGAIAWTDITSADVTSHGIKKPILIVFHAKWCASCREYSALFRDQRVIAASKSFLMVLVNVEREKEGSTQFSLDGDYVPRTYFLSSSGEPIKGIGGSIEPKMPHSVDPETPDELLSLMRKASASKE